MRFSTLILSAALAFAPAAFGQAPAGAPMAAPPCEGTVVMVRLSEIKPGKMDTFLKAAAAQQAWYRANGVTTDQVMVARIFDRNPATGGYKTSETQAYTYHINPPGPEVKLPRGDEKYKAFVAMFRESSEIKSEMLTCTPKM